MERVERRPSPNKQTVYTPTPITLAEDLRQLHQAPSPEEIARRTKAVKEMLALRDRQPVEGDVTEILRAAREEEDRKLDG